MSKYETDYIVILVCDNIPNQKFWNESIQDWTTSFDEATVYPTYGSSAKVIWDLPDEKVTHRVTSSNKTLYYLMLSGQWDGYSIISDNSESQSASAKEQNNERRKQD